MGQRGEGLRMGWCVRDVVVWCGALSRGHRQRDVIRQQFTRCWIGHGVGCGEGHGEGCGGKGADVCFGGCDSDHATDKNAPTKARHQHPSCPHVSVLTPLCSHPCSHLSCWLGSPQYTALSSRPGRSKAASMRSGREVAPMTHTPLRPSTPSSSVSSWFTTRSVTP